ncbi:uncharacterized protein LOC134278829 [Saccostrea cucullata]|uniref:uncharacterized protein LOC134278829 n=1 Tax=Saccostrea cuccullata TaxID=36930 RepID=UPI002ED4FB6B
MSHNEFKIPTMPVQCQLQKIVVALHRFRHNMNKSALAIQIWENADQKKEIKEETVELQRLIEIELNSIINLASNAKAESSILHNKLRELQSKVAHLEEEIREKHKQCEFLQQQVDELNFKDINIEAEMISAPKQQLQSKADQKNEVNFKEIEEEMVSEPNEQLQSKADDKNLKEF